MSEQFSKLNKFSHSLATKRPMELARNIGRKSEIIDGIKPKFTVGKRELSGKILKSNSSSEDSINNDNEENINLIEIQTARPLDFQHDGKLMEAYTPRIGIIMGVKNNEVDEVGEDVSTKMQINADDNTQDVSASNLQV